MNTPHTHLVPTSSQPRPPAGDDLRNRPRPSSPSPSGDEVELASSDDVTTNPSTSSPGTRSTRAELNHLLLAAHVAQITGDAPGVMAVLVGSSILKDGRR